MDRWWGRGKVDKVWAVVGLEGKGDRGWGWRVKWTGGGVEGKVNKGWDGVWVGGKVDVGGGRGRCGHGLLIVKQRLSCQHSSKHWT